MNGGLEATTHVPRRALTLLLLAPAAAGLSACSDGSASSPSQRPDTPVEIRIERVFPRVSFDQPIGALPIPGDDAWWVFEKSGRILRLAGDDPDAATEVANLGDRVEAGSSEAGLLGIAFHPDFALNGEVYVSYTRAGAPLTSVIARYHSADGGLTLDPASEQDVLTLPQPFANHNGGHVLFGPDGFLYAGFGDGGSAGDPLNNAQDTGSLLGAILRLDVDGAAPYAIPADNPFAGGGGRGEVWAYGLRNPWRFQFDRASGELWAADVGQYQWEEIDRITRGGNYGWNVREGAHCYGQASCDDTDMIDPLAEYDHSEGCSITGGFVYRGSALRGFDGAYFYGDFCSGTVWALQPAAGGYSAREIAATGLSIVSFAEDEAGELRIVDMNGGIYALRAAAVGARLR